MPANIMGVWRAFLKMWICAAKVEKFHTSGQHSPLQIYHDDFFTFEWLTAILCCSLFHLFYSKLLHRPPPPSPHWQRLLNLGHFCGKLYCAWLTVYRYHCMTRSTNLRMGCIWNPPTTFLRKFCSDNYHILPKKLGRYQFSNVLTPKDFQPILCSGEM